MKICQKFVVLVHYPFTNRGGAKIRPALVVSSQRFNIGSDVVVLPMTSHRSTTFFEMDLASSDLEGGSLAHISSVKCGHLSTIDKSLILKTVAKVRHEKFQEIMEKMMQVF